jgi:hypothetical protein
MESGQTTTLHPSLPFPLQRYFCHISRRIGYTSPRLHSLYKKLKYSPYYPYGSLADPYELRFVDPNDIETYWEGQYYHFNLEIYGEIVTGDWDRNTKQIATHRKFRSIRQHFEEGKSWNETPVYRFLEEYVQNEGPIDGVESVQEIDQRYDQLEEVYHTIENEGYKTQQEIDTQQSVFDEICISIGRSGEMIFNCSGWHRLSIAKVLDVDEIPVYVLFRHKEWQDTREAIWNQDDQQDELRNHPDLVDVL